MTNQEFINLLYSKDIKVDDQIDQIFEQTERIIGSNILETLSIVMTNLETGSNHKPSSKSDGCIRISKIMEILDVEKISLKAKIALVTITSMHEHKIPYWKQFVEKCYNYSKEKEGEERAKKLYQGFYGR